MNWRNEFKSREDALVTAMNSKTREAAELDAHAGFLRGEVRIIEVELAAIRRALTEDAVNAAHTEEPKRFISGSFSEDIAAAINSVRNGTGQ